jgi:hypothetical protein
MRNVRIWVPFVVIVAASVVPQLRSTVEAQIQAGQNTHTGTVETIELLQTREEAELVARSMAQREADDACERLRDGETIEAGVEPRMNCIDFTSFCGGVRYKCEAVWYARCTGAEPNSGGTAVPAEQTPPAEPAADEGSEAPAADEGSAAPAEATPTDGATAGSGEPSE